MGKREIGIYKYKFRSWNKYGETSWTDTIMLLRLTFTEGE